MSPALPLPQAPARASLAWLTLSLFVSTPAWAQVMDTKVPLRGWRTIKTEHFELIYPFELEALAQGAATTLEHIQGPVSAGLHTEPKRIPLLLENSQMMANGYVSLAPRRSAFFLVPPPSTTSWLGLGSTTGWFDALAVHEYRHVTQFSNALHGTTKYARWIAGEYGWAGGAFASSPMWFFEGDAVTTETLLSSGGRGRNPGFDIMTRVQLLEGGPATYNRAYLGSMKDPWANIYTLGYLLSVYGRREHGAELWPKVSRSAAIRAFTPYPFSRALYRETGMRLPAFYQAAMKDLHQRWTDQLQGLEITESRLVHERRTRVAWDMDLSPRPLEDGSILLLRFGKDDPGSILRVDPQGREKLLARVPQHNEESLSLSSSGQLLAWSEYRQDPRWTARSYSIVRLMDLRTGSVRDLTRRSRVVSPDFSPDEKSVVVVEYGMDLRASLAVMDIAGRGAVKSSFPCPPGEAWHTPRWLADGKGIAYISHHDKKGLAIGVLDLESGKHRLLWDFEQINISDLVVAGERLFYVSSASGIENVWAADIHSGARWQVTSRRYAALSPMPSPDGESLYFADYSYRGTRIHQAPLDPSSWTPAEQVQDRSLRYFEPILSQEPAGGDILQDIPPKSWESRPYRRLPHMLHVHSWYPLLLPDGPRVGAAIVTEDMTDTTAASLQYLYHLDEETHGLGSSLTWQGLYPILDLDGFVGGRHVTLPRSPDGRAQEASWTEHRGGLGVRVPLNLSSGAWNRRLSATLGAELVRASGLDAGSLELEDPGDLAGVPSREGLLQVGRASLSFQQNLWINRRALGPRWGQSVDLSTRQTPFGGDMKGAYLAASAGLYLPAPGRLQSLSLHGSYQRRELEGYVFASELSFIRGYQAMSWPELAQASVDWDLPLFYPDRGLGPVIFLQRVKLGLFYDQAQGWSEQQETRYQSTGLELSGDFNLFRIPATLDLGVRMCYLPIEARWVPEPVIGGVF